MCTEMILENTNRKTCHNLNEIVKKDTDQLTRLITIINTLYAPQTNKRRGLFDGIGTVVKLYSEPWTRTIKN